MEDQKINNDNQNDEFNHHEIDSSKSNNKVEPKINSFSSNSINHDSNFSEKQSEAIDENNENITKPKAINTPLNLILQWLTYAFWGWEILAISFSAVLVFSYYIASSDSSSFSPFVIAASLVLLPIAFFTDFYYTKNEPVKKSGPASLIMVIHAVIFAILGISALIATVFALIYKLVHSGDTKAFTISIYVSLISLVLYLLVFFRTVLPFSPRWYKKAFWISIVTISLAINTFTIIGPTYQAKQSSKDNLIDNNLGIISSAITDYTYNNDQLPDSLTKLNLNGDALILVKDNLVEYKPQYYQANNNQNHSAINKTTPNYKNLSLYNYSKNYQLCVNYKKPKKSQYTGLYNNSYYTPTTPYVENHPSGHYCYDLQA